MDRYDRDCDRSNGSAAEEQTDKRRLTDLISDAICHAAIQGRKMIAENLRLINDAIKEEDEAEYSFHRRSDDASEKYLDR